MKKQTFSPLNLCTFSGKMFRDAEMSYSPSGLAVTKFTIPMNYWDGKAKQTMWIECVAFGEYAEFLAEPKQNLRPGTIVAVSGEIQVRPYLTKSNSPEPRVNISLVLSECHALYVEKPYLDTSGDEDYDKHDDVQALNEGRKKKFFEDKSKKDVIEDRPF